MVALKLLYELSALLRVVVVNHGKADRIHVERDAVGDGELKDKRAQYREREPYRIADKLHRLAVGKGEDDADVVEKARLMLPAVTGSGGAFLLTCSFLILRIVFRSLLRRGVPALAGDLLLEVADERLLKCRRLLGLPELLRGADCKHLAAVHEGDAVAPCRLVHEVGGDEDGDALLTGEGDEVVPEHVAGSRIDSGCRFVKDEDLRAVLAGGGELQPLLDAEGERRGLLVGAAGEPEALKRLLYDVLPLILREVVEPRVELEVLTDSELLVERERLRHVADLHADGEVLGVDGLPEDAGVARRRIKEARQHLHRG